MADGDVIYDVKYSFDDLYRRIVPGQPEKDADKFVVFFGGSQTFGEGLNDEQTIPALAQQAAPSYRVYNYAYRGYGPHQMLRMIETNELKDQLKETNGIAFYQYFHFHVPRAVGSMGYISWAGAGAPYYRLNGEQELEYGGSFATGRWPESLLYWVLGKSAILKYYRVDLPTKKPQHSDLVCLILKKSKDEFIDQFPGSRFVVIIGMNNVADDPVEQCLRSRGIEYVDMRDKYDPNAELTYRNDGHFTPKGARLTVDSLLTEIIGE
jgi:hypothetical protein